MRPLAVKLTRMAFTRYIAGAAFATFAMASSNAYAQTTFDVIGPHEYDLPVNFSPFNVFVQYTYIQDDSHVWDANGDRVKGSGAQRVVGLSKYVHFWNPDFNHNIGLAWEVIQPEVNISNPGSGNDVSGLGDTITGFAAWYKPTAQSTLGIQSFVQIPWGTPEVSDKNWKNLTSLFWDVRLPENFGWTADAGFVWQSENDNDQRPGLTFHTNQRFGWKANQWFEPFLALDYEHTDSSGSLPTSWALDGGVGVMVNFYKAESLTLRYSTSFAGENHSDNNSWNLKYVHVW